MQIRKISFASLMFISLSIAGTVPIAVIAQQEDDANASNGVREYLRIQSDSLKPEPLRLRWSDDLSSTTNRRTTATDGVVIMEGETDVPEEEHLETWVSRALSIYAQSDDEESRMQQRAEIAKGLNTIFDLRHQQRVKELRELEARVQKLKNTLDQRAASKSEIVAKRLDYLIHEADGLGWGDGIPAPKRSGITGIRFTEETPSEQPAPGESEKDATVPKTVPH